MRTPLLRNSKKLINAWAMYDWANSVYSLSIATAIFPIYYASATGAVNGGIVHFIGRDFNNEALYAYALSFSFIMVAVISPMLAPIADFKGSKLGFMQFFCYLGAVSCAALYFFTGENITWGIVFFVLASIGFAGSIVYYNAYLKEIVDEKDQDKVSARGFSMGYIGSVLLLILNLLMVQQPQWFGISTSGEAARISFLTVAVWWVVFAQIPFAALRRFKYEAPVKSDSRNHSKITLSMVMGGYNELRIVWNELKHIRSLRRYLVSFFFFNSGVQTVMYMASIFGSEVIFTAEDDKPKLIMCILLIQIVGIFGAWLFSRLSRRYGNVAALSIAILIWIVVCLSAYILETQLQFYVIAFLVGLVMGGIQSISRSTYSKLIPPTKDTAAYFSFYDATEKLATVFGTLVYGLVTESTGNMRNSILFLLLFFVIGIMMLMKIRREKSLLPA